MTPAEIAEVHRQNLAHLMIADPAAVDALAVHIQDLNTQRARFRLTAWTAEDRLSSTGVALAPGAGSGERHLGRAATLLPAIRATPAWRWFARCIPTRISG